MKTLLTLLGSVGLFTTAAAAPFLGANNITVKNNQTFSEKFIWWNANRDSEKIKVSNSEEYFGLKTINLGKDKNFTKLSFIGEMASQTLWGSTPYEYSWKSLDITWNNNFKLTSVNRDTILNYANLKLLNVRDTSGLAKLTISFWSGMAWYQENGEYYLQWFFYYSGTSYNSLSSTHNTLNISPGVILS